MDEQRIALPQWLLILFRGAMKMRFKKKTDEALIPMKNINPLVGYTLDEIQVFIDEINPNCGRGGYSHKKSDHIINIERKFECHKCSCKEFIQ